MVGCEDRIESMFGWEDGGKDKAFLGGQGKQNARCGGQDKHNAQQGQEDKNNEWLVGQDKNIIWLCRQDCLDRSKIGVYFWDRTKNFFFKWAGQRKVWLG